MVLAAILAEKGGSGKTTTAMFAARGLSDHGRVVVLDVSPQRTASKWAEAAGDGLGFDVVNPDDAPTLRQLVADYDHVLVDSPPEILPIIENVIRSVELVIAPVRPSWADLRQAAELSARVEALRDHQGLPRLRWLLTHVTHGTTNRRRALEILEAGEQDLFATEIRYWQVYASAGGQPIGELYAYRKFVAELIEFDRALDQEPTRW